MLQGLTATPSPEWETIHSAVPVVIKPPRKAKIAETAHRVFAILPDPQIGYRNLNGILDPFHDEKAMDVALQIVDWLYHNDRVDGVVNLGDFLDLPSQGKHMQEPSFAGTTQLAINRGHLFLQQQRAVAGEQAEDRAH